ncbi:MAG: hypothetical protein KIS66_10130 [Fimbriimonadaceae bacterium]|nr:hypothetical protein [Fimbriimonadaceae bacterium]
MSAPAPTTVNLKVADEVFLVMADLHRRNPDREDFSVSEILNHASRLNLSGSLRPGVAVHVRQHCVANLPPNPGAYQMLFATAKARRRLLLPGDVVHPLRGGKKWPNLHQVPSEHHDLVRWAIQRYEQPGPEPEAFQELLDLIGSGKGLWPEGVDNFINGMRDGWR